MRILICVKQVPGTNNVEVDPITGVLKRDGVVSKMNPYDLYALEMGVSLAEKAGGKVTAITMGPPQAKSVVNEAIMMGAENGVIISDRRFVGSDVLATSYTLAQGIQNNDSFDLIICGKQTTDGDTAQVGAEIAEHLNIPHITNVKEIINADKNELTLRCGIEHLNITQKVKLPCLICAEGGINTPRLPSYKRSKELTEDMITFMSLDDMSDTSENNYGLLGSPTQVVEIFPPGKNTEKEVWKGEAVELSSKLYNMLKQAKFV